AVVLDDVNALVAGDEIPRGIVERQRANPQIAGIKALLAQAIAGLNHAGIGRAGRDQADFGATPPVTNRRSNSPARRVPLATQARSVVQPVVWALAVDSTLVVAGPARNIRAQRVLDPWQRTIADPVAIRIFVARTTPGALDVLGGQHLAAIHRLVRIFKRIAHPEVHAQVEVAQHEDQGLQPLRQVERAPAELKHLGDAAR